MTTALTKTTAPDSYASATVAVTENAADTGSQNHYVSTGKELIIFRNSNATTAYTITITSQTDDYGRLGHITTEAIGSGIMKVFGPVKNPGWRNSSGNVLCEASNANVLISVITVP